MTDTAAFRVQHIDHLAISVRDIERSAAWYCDVLGLERRPVPEWGDEPTMVCAGDTCIALFRAPAGAASPPGRDAVAMRHIAFRVDRLNFERAREAFERMGIDARFADHGIAHSLYVSDPDGHAVEITTYDIPSHP